MSRGRAELAVALLVFSIAAPWGRDGGVNELPRLALAAAIVEHGSFEITAYDEVVSVDRAERAGNVYSDKAPGTSFAFVPVYAAVHTIAGYDLFSDTAEIRIIARIWLSAIPAAALAALLMLFLRDERRGRSVWLTVSLVLGTMLLPFATVAFGHELAAFLAFAAFMLVRPPDASRWRLAAGGVVAGCGVLVEYPVAIVALALLVYRVVIDRRSVRWYVGGASPMAALLAWYHLSAFGSVFATPYRYAATFGGTFSGVGLRFPDAGDIGAVLVGERGLFVLTPIVLVAIAGFFLRGSLWAAQKRELTVAAVIVGAFVLVPAMWLDDGAGPWGGYSPGPRFVVPALPFLIVPLRLAFARWPRTATGVGLVGLATMGMATITDPLVPHVANIHAFPYWLEHVGDGSYRYNLLYDWFGKAGVTGWLLVVGLLAALVLVVVRRADSASASSPWPPAGRAVATMRSAGSRMRAYLAERGIEILGFLLAAVGLFILFTVLGRWL